jgi:ApbE superfamily uncharacterized protein (UPF0280 family)
LRARAALLPDGRRLHLQDGPIDLVVEALGPAGEAARAYDAARNRFATVLDELCDELPELRRQARPGVRRLSGAIARRMEDAVQPFCAESFITPMAAVAGAVAEEILEAMTRTAQLERAYVNNGGDIALHLAAGTSLAIGLVDRPDRPSLFGRAMIEAAMPVRGIATSGWRGRSFSLGIADAATVLARTAAPADAAATIVANAVDLPGHAGIERVPARDLSPDSDLGARPVTRAVGPLTSADRAEALRRGAAAAERLVAAGVIQAAALRLGEDTLTIGAMRGVLAHA